MCIGIALRVSVPDGEFAWCEDGNARERIDMMLVGAQPAGTWVLAFHGAARQVLSDEEAALSRTARDALAAVLAGEPQLDRYFADLVSREPQLPAHLLPEAEG